MEDREVINGTWGEVWLESDYVSESTALQIKIDLNKEDINICRRLAKGSKVVGWEGKGSLKMHKANSRMGKLLSESLKTGKFPTYTIMSNLADPDAKGFEKIVVTGVSFDDLTLMDWENAKNGEIEAPFTFTGYDYKDAI